MLPTKQGLYDPRFEHDACGVSFVADLQGRRSHRMVELGLASLCNLDHRGATNAEPNVGRRRRHPDPGARPRSSGPSSTSTCPPAGAYATGIAFLPRDPEPEAAAMAGIEKIAASEGLQVLGWREVPVDNSMIGQQAAEVEPSFRQVFLTAAEGQPPLTDIALDRRCFVVRKRVEHELATRRRAGVLPEPLGPHPRLQGDAHLVPGRRLLHRPHRRARRVGAGPRAQPLLHQHVPVVAPRPPVPVRRPQRRDQHGDGQRELDAGPRGAPRDRPASTASSGPSRSARPTARTPPASTRCSSCCTSAATRSPTPC